MKGVQGVVFDLWNTLVFSHREISPYTLMFGALGLSGRKKSAARKLALTQDFASMGDLARRLRPDISIDVREFEERLEREVALAGCYEDVKDTLSSLQGAGIRLGLISNIASQYKKVFFNLGLEGWI
ncbi:MAG TPA: hypothetical protein VJG90_06790 [Candidatus Nanoarchaeia archaeon]|nr:hypothetical protein [Candidatus Nanoarchaeia archaeon]